MPTTIRKAIITEYGDESKVNIVSADVEDPQQNEVQVKVIYSGFNGGDINMRLGRYPLQKKPPFTPGYTLVGTVSTNGPQSRKFKKGDIVAAMTKYDAEAELVNVPEKHLYLVPSGLDLKQACAMILDWNTAYGMVMHSAQVSAGQKVFVHGMSGAVGYATMILCQLRGAKVYGTASARNHEAIREAGGAPFVYTDKKWMTEMKKLGGANVVFDPLGFESWDESYDILDEHDGLLVGFGSNAGSFGGEPDRSTVGSTLKLFAKNAKLWSHKRTKFYFITRDDKTFGSDLSTLFHLLGQGQVQVPIKHVWKLSDIQDAHRGYSSTPGTGSFLIQVSDEPNSAKQ